MKARFAFCFYIACFVAAHGDGLSVPPYPEAALKANQGGVVGIKVSYGEGGVVKAVDITTSSGVPVLDSATKAFVLSHWKNLSMSNQSATYTMTFDPANPGPLIDKTSVPVNDDPNALTASLTAQPQTKDTALTLYQRHIQAVLNYYWAFEVKQHAADLEAGTVKFKYVIHSDGSISDVIVVDGGNFEVLKKVGEDVLLAGTPYRPFTPELTAEVGDKYTDTKSFTISR